VQIGDHPDLAGRRLAGHRGAITEIREYLGPVVRYRVRGLDPADDAEAVCGLYAEQAAEPRTMQLAKASSLQADCSVDGTGDGSDGNRRRHHRHQDPVPPANARRAREGGPRSALPA
jgi:hypothetical protein